LKNSPNPLKTDADASMEKENEQSPSLYKEKRTTHPFAQSTSQISFFQQGLSFIPIALLFLRKKFQKNSRPSKQERKPVKGQDGEKK
jgi:hypothetical protein